MLEERVCQAGGIHNYYDTMSVISTFDPGLANFITSRIPHNQWHQMIHVMMSDARPMYRRLVKTFEAMERGEQDMIVDGAPIPTLQSGWDIANEIAAGYRCDIGFTDKPQIFTVLVTMKMDQPVTGLPLAVIRASDGIARDMESTRKWTFGFDNRQFIMDLGPDAIRELRNHPFVESIEYEEEPSMRILMANCIPPYNPAIEQTDWGVQRILTATPWGLSPALLGQRVKVCVIDTGIDYNHPAYWKDGVCVYKGGYNFVGANEDPKDDQDHGCVWPDAVIYTSEGAMRIEDFWKMHGGEGVEVDVSRKKISTISLNPDVPETQVSQVLKVFRIPIHEEVVRLKMLSGMELILTPWHPTYVWDGRTIVEKRADQVQNDDFLVSPATNSAILGKDRYVHGRLLDVDLAYAVGAYLSRTKSEAGSLLLDSRCVARKFTECLRDRVDKMVCRDAEDYSVCEWEGGYFTSVAEELRKPGAVLQLIGGSPLSVISSFLAGYLDGTGYCSWRSALLRFSTESKSLAYQISYLVALTGVDSTMQVRGQVYTVTMTGIENFRKILNMCWDSIEKPFINRRMRAITNALPENAVPEPVGYRLNLLGNFHLDCVATIDRLPYHGDFYDLEVSDQHNYLAGVHRPSFVHNTWCAGVIAEQHNGAGYRGVAPNVELYACKVLDSKGSGSYNNVAAGIDWARTNGCHIISLSLGGEGSAAVLKTACDTAWYAGLLICASAGNSGPEDNTVGYPAAYQSVVAVAAMDSYERVADFSSRGPEVEITAPGVYITAPWAGFTYDEYATPDQMYMCASGTSPACPHVAGAAALIKCWYPFITNIDLRVWLKDHVRDL